MIIRINAYVKLEELQKASVLLWGHLLSLLVVMNL